MVCTRGGDDRRRATANGLLRRTLPGRDAPPRARIDLLTARDIFFLMAGVIFGGLLITCRTFNRRGLLLLVYFAIVTFLVKRRRDVRGEMNLPPSPRLERGGLMNDIARIIVILSTT